MPQQGRHQKLQREEAVLLVVWRGGKLIANSLVGCLVASCGSSWVLWWLLRCAGQSSRRQA